MEQFLDLKVDLKEFGDIYNNYTERKMNFGGGMTTVKDLLANATFLEENTIKKGGNAFYNSLFLDKTNNNNWNSDNIFHSTLPANNTSSYTDVNSTWDMTQNTFEYPGTQPISRSFVF